MHLIEDDVVISGVGGYFPKSLNIEEFQKNLLSNEILLETRWKYGERGVSNVIGKVPTEHFDNAYFGIHRQQCTFMDPMQRLVLERTFEALVDAGVNPNEVRGRRIGCFMASAIGENDNLFLESIISGFGITGHSRAMMPNRISYWLNLKGPSVAYDSNWIGGIEVLRLAYEAIKTGQCESVIIGSANLALNAEFQWIYNDMGVLSPDGSIKAFDADAKGYARSDGVVVLYIQRASEARRAYASIVNVATAFNGQRPGNLLDIDVDNMVNFMEEFYQKAGFDPANVDFVEAYGCAQKVIDEKEVAALERVYCKNRKNPLLIGSVKTNTGHAEASASLFSIVKVLIAMETQTIPATLQFEKPNPNISALLNGKVQVVTENKKWDGLYAAVNAIGLDSYYGHVLLKANPKRKQIKKDDLPRLVIASTRTEDGMKELLETIKNQPQHDPEYYKLIHDLFSKPILGHLYRGYAIVGTEEVKQEVEYHLGNKRQIWFVYSGMGSQWNGMLGDLMKLPVFANAINKCAAILEKKGVDLMHILTSQEKTLFDNILHSFVGIAAMQIALTDVLHSVGIYPDGIIGHSVGELGCAYADGCMTAEEMILASYSRGKASLDATLIKGMMAAVGLGYNQIKSKIPPTIEVACHNGPDSCTISGPTEDMEKFVQELQSQGTFARLVNVANIAYHSRYIKPAAPILLKYLKEVIPTPKERSSKWISTSNLEENWDTDLAKYSSPDYHTNNLLSSVLFEEGLHHIPKDSVLIEIAPHGLLQAILKRSLKNGCSNIALTQRGSTSSLEFLLQALGKLYLAGLNFNIGTLFPEVEYPVSRGTACLANLVHWEHSETWRTGLEDKLKCLYGVRDIQVTLNSEEFRDCVGHQLDDQIVLPVSSYLNIIYNIIANISTGHKDVIFENLHFRKMLTVPRIGSVPLHAMIQKGSGEFEIINEKEIIVTGRMTFPQAGENFLVENTDLEITEENVQLSGNDIYNEFQHRGHKYTGLFKTIKSLTIGEQGSIGVIQWNNKWTMFLETMIQQHLLQSGERTQEIHVPKTIQKIAFSQTILPEEKSDLKVSYTYSTGILATEGIQVIGLTSVALPKAVKPVSFDSVEFVPFNDNSNVNMEYTINAAFHVTLENNNGTNQYLTSLMLAEISSKNESLLENIKNVTNNYSKLNVTVLTAKDLKSVLTQNQEPPLLVYNDFITDELVKFLASTKTFLLVRTNKNLLNYNQITEVAHFNVNGISYSLVRKANSVQPIVVTVKSDVLSLKDLSRGSVSWVSELETAVNDAKNKGASVYLISSVVPTESITNFTQELVSQPKMDCVRMLFNLDKRTSDVDLKDPLYQRIFQQDIILTVIKDGLIGSYLPVPVKIKDDVVNNFVTSTAIKNRILHYISVNLKDETQGINKKPELGNIDYSGVTNNGQKIMGLATIDKDLCKLIPDSILSWEVPENWTLEDAATVPNAYACAYYTLFIKANLKPGETVLIHAGCTAIGLAAISIASIHGCTVYTTVSTDWQRAYLKKQFICLKDRNILSSDNTNFEPLLKMATGGLGAHVILNCLSGSLLQASVACLADYGRFIQIGKYDLEENNSIGMNIFLRNTSFYVVDLQNIFNAPNTVKEELRDLVQSGLKRLSVRPIIRKVVEHQDIEQILGALQKTANVGKIVIKINNSLLLNKFNLEKSNQFVCDEKASYLVYGGSSDLWTDVVEWLVLRGARKIVVSSESKPQQVYINRRLSLLQAYYGADIIYSPNKAQTREGAAELLSEVYFIGPIHAVFVLPANKGNLSRTSDIKPVHFIDQALRTTAPKALLVNFISSAAGVCQLRAEAGFNTFNIQWQKDLEITDTFEALDGILNLKVKNILVKNEKTSDSYQETTQSLFKKLSLLLPSSLESLIEEARNAPPKPEFIQLPTLGPREIRELAPVFIIPGLAGQKETKDFAYELLYPTFYAQLPSSPMSLQEMAVELVEKMKKIWPKGPYNIVGVSWGGTLTLEIARILNKEGASLHLYFIDGAPNTIQSALKHLGETPSSREGNLLTRILNINDSDVAKSISDASTWESRVKIALDRYKGDLGDDRAKVEQMLNNIRKRIQDLCNYQPTDELVSGQIHLIRPQDSSKYDNCGLLSYCKQTPKITLVPGDHLSIINSPVTSEYVNDKHYLI